MWAMVEAHSLILASSADSTAFSHSVMTVSSCLTVSAHFLLSNLSKVSLLSQLSDRVIAGFVFPVGLVGGESFDGGVGGDKPIFYVVRGLELFEQHALERGRLLIFLGLSGGVE